MQDSFPCISCWPLVSFSPSYLTVILGYPLLKSTMLKHIRARRPTGTPANMPILWLYSKLIRNVWLFVAWDKEDIRDVFYVSSNINCVCVFLRLSKTYWSMVPKYINFRACSSICLLSNPRLPTKCLNFKWLLNWWKGLFKELPAVPITAGSYCFGRLGLAV